MPENTNTTNPELVEELLFTDSVELFEIQGGDSVNGLLRVRQKATRADSINKNRRVYPRKVMQSAIERARPHAKAGAMLCEYVHPDIVKTAAGKQGYVDNPDRKTARVDDISDVAADGWVYITRTILDTPHGQKLAQRYRAGQPPGISTRFRMQGHQAAIDGHQVMVADAIDLHTWDDVEDPAVDGAGQFVLLADSVMTHLTDDMATKPGPAEEDDPAEIHIDIGSHNEEEEDAKVKSDAVPDPDDTVEEVPEKETVQEPRQNNRGTISGAAQDTSAAGAQEETHSMNATLKRALDHFRNQFEIRAPHSDVMRARKAFFDEVEKEYKEKEMPAEEKAEAMKAEGDMAVAGYNPDRPVVKPILGYAIGANERGGWGSEIDRPQEPDPVTKTEVRPVESGTLKNDGLTADEMEEWRQERAARKLQQEEENRKAALRAAVDNMRTNPILAGLTDEQREFVTDRAIRYVTKPEDVEKFVTDEVEGLSRIVAKERLASQGMNGAGSGVTVQGTQIEVKQEARPWMGAVDRLCACADEARRFSGAFTTEPIDMRIREYNRRVFLDPLLEQMATDSKKYKSIDEWVTAEDSLCTGAELDFMNQMFAAQDNTTVSQLLNQPTISMFLLVQAFQDMRALQFVHGVGPGMRNTAGGYDIVSDGRFGQVIRIPVEYYTAPDTYGVQSGTYDAGLLVPENTGIPEMQVGVAWLPFGAQWRRIAASLTRDVIRAMGNGPLNYPAVARHLYHMALHKSRTIDKALLDEMINISDEYGATTVTAQTHATAVLANNSVYLVGGSITINLNPTKTAVAAVVSTTDTSVTYGTNVVAGIRIRTASAGTASPYVGQSTAYGNDPIVRPRTSINLTVAGAVSTTTVNPFSVGGVGAQVAGYLDSTGSIQNLPGTTATYAVDYENGVVVFNAAGYALMGVAGMGTAGGVLTGNNIITLTYAYATNYDNFIVNNPTLATGQTLEMYLNGLLTRMDATAAAMGSSPRFVKPDLALMTLNASVNITTAQIFYKLQSPDGTKLFPSEDFFATRTGIDMARHNAPWNPADKRILLTRRGSTKYIVDTPFEVRGPYPAYSSGAIVARDIYYAEENSVICTPQTVDSGGNVLNPVARSIKLR